MMEKQQRNYAKAGIRARRCQGRLGQMCESRSDGTCPAKRHMPPPHMMHRRKARQDLQALRDGWDNSYAILVDR